MKRIYGAIGALLLVSNIATLGVAGQQVRRTALLFSNMCYERHPQENIDKVRTNLFYAVFNFCFRSPDEMAELKEELQKHSLVEEVNIILDGTMAQIEQERASMSTKTKKQVRFSPTKQVLHYNPEDS